MILNTHHHVKLQKPIKKILYLYPAYNDTFVILGLINERQDGIVHLNKHGQELFRHLFGISMDSIGMLSDRQVILLETRRNKILILHLQGYSFQEFPHQFMYEQADQTQIHTFSQSKLLCIEEKGRYNNAKYKLTYFRYPLELQQKKQKNSTKKSTKALTLYESNINQWTYQYMTRKANNYSMMCWYKPRHDDSFEFRTYQVVGDKGRYKLYKFHHAIACDISNGVAGKVETAILNVWESKRSQFIFVCLSNKSQVKKTGGTIINNNYIIDTTSGEIRESKFTFGPYQDYLIDYYNLGPYSMFKTFKVEDSKLIKSPVYYIDHENQVIFGEQSWQCSHLYKYQFPGYASGLLCQGKYENVDNNEFQLVIKRVVNGKLIYLSLLDGFGQTIGQDLIFDTLCVLDLQ